MALVVNQLTAVHPGVQFYNQSVLPTAAPPLTQTVPAKPDDAKRCKRFIIFTKFAFIQFYIENGIMYIYESGSQGLVALPSFITNVTSVNAI